METYEKFLKEKFKEPMQDGIEVNELNPKLFDFQKHIVSEALKKARYAIFADTGLGKTFMQIEWAYQVARSTKRKVLILAPLAVGGQTILEGAKLGYKIEKINSGNESINNLYITNYEQIQNIIDMNYSGVYIEDFFGVVLDESSILKNFTGKMRNLIIDTFAKTPFKLACTATPSPNDLMELGNHSEFLNYLTRDEMLATYFTHDGGETAKWRLKGHAVNNFYSWIGCWATVISLPSDIGYETESAKYRLNGINYFEIQVVTPKKDNGMLFNDSSVNAIDFNRELRETESMRIKEAVKIIENSNDSFIVWVNQNSEGDNLLIALRKYGAVQVTGSDSVEKKESLLLQFAKGEHRILITKAKIAGMGLNFQNCNNQIFVGLDFSFEKLYQSVRRSYRFGQTKQVNIYLITTDTMQNVSDKIKEKEENFKQMRIEMTKVVNSKFQGLKTSEYETMDMETENYHIMRGDCVQRIREVKSESIGLSVFSPPFADLYTYSDHLEDMGNSKDWKEFIRHWGYLTPELYRILKPGRNVAIHCMDLPIQKGKEGYIGLRDFSGMLLRTMKRAGFVYHSRITIWKDPVIEMQRTKALGLLHKQVKKDSTMSRVGIPDYVLVFRKDGDRPDPVTNKEMSVDEWQKIASPVWMDINYGKTLQYRSARQEEDEKHICPLQLETIEKLIKLYTNKGDTVFTPFMGIGSEVYESVRLGRKGVGIELKESYYDQAVKNLRVIGVEKTQMEIFG